MARLYHNPASVAIGARGILIDNPYKGPTVQPPQLVGVKRGKVTTLSGEAVKRLRRALMTAYVPGLEPYALTLTVPIAVDDWHEHWRACLDRYWHSCLRLNGWRAAIWRVELQQRGMPHLHCVVWADNDMVMIHAQRLWERALGGWPLIPPCSVKRKVCGQWVEVDCSTQADAYVDGAFDGMSRSTTCRLDRLSGSSSSVRYLCDHTSKRKQAQLGYQGRQWGIVGRQRLSWLDDGLDLSERQIVVLLRVIRRWSRHWYNSHYRGRLARLHLRTIGHSEVWADETLRGRLLAWLSSTPTEAADASPVSPNAGAWRHGEARGRS